MKSPATFAGLALAAGLLVAPMLAPAIAHADEPTAPDESALAASWLADQFVDGTHLLGFDGSADPANTIDGILALYEAGVGGDVADQATQWVVSQAPEFATNPGSAGRAAILADVADIDPTNFGGVNLVEQMNGELGDLTTNPYALGLLVLGLESSEAEVPQNVLDALLATQEQAGSFGYTGFGTDLDATAMAVQALASIDDDPAADAALGRGLDWLVANQCTATSEACPEVGAYWGSYSPANTAGLVIPALADADIDTTEQLAWLVGQQLPDGSFPAGFGMPAGDPYATAQAILGLNSATLDEVERSEPVAVPSKTPSASAAPSASSSPAATASSAAPTADASSPMGDPNQGARGGGFSLTTAIGLGVAVLVVRGAVGFMIARKK